LAGPISLSTFLFLLENFVWHLKAAERENSVSDRAEGDEGEKSNIENDNRENDSSKRDKENIAAGGEMRTARDGSRKI
jgi:hypothetical protein